jgi:hypothetical protein
MICERCHIREAYRKLTLCLSCYIVLNPQSNGSELGIIILRGSGNGRTWGKP